MFGLFNKDILGNNKRIRDFILSHNRRKHYPLVDNKVLTAKIAEENNLPIPETYFVISSHGQLRNIIEKLKGLETFVVKPAKGAMGNGILIVKEIIWDETNIKKTKFVTNRKKTMDLGAFTYYIGGILSGLYSLNGHADQAIFQKKLDLHPVFSEIVSMGVPDIRVILFDGFPVLAMTRLPPESSGGRGNLHQGAVGSGIDMKTGQITRSIQKNKPITHHPDTGVELKSIVIPFWQEVLELSAKCAEVSKLGYIGVDIVIDEHQGPLLLEMNARPGLSIQLANGKGLNSILQKVESAPENLEMLEKIKWADENLF